MTTSDTESDDLLAALDQLTNAIYWFSDRYPLRADTALVEALEDWISEHSAEHHRSQPFTAPATGADPLANVLAQLLAAVAQLCAIGARPGLTVTAALTEAVGEWASLHAAEHHHDQPFQRPTTSTW